MRRWILVCITLVFVGGSLFAENALAVYISNPETRQVKSRLAKESSREVADTFYYHCLDILTEDLTLLSKDYTIYIYPVFPTDLDWAEGRWPQFNSLAHPPSNNLGDRICATINSLLDQDYERVLVIGSDAPSLPIAYINENCHLLNDHQTVLGPAEDGGFYLIGSKQKLPSLHAVRWSTPCAYEDTHHLLTKGLSVGTGPLWYDIDHVQDLERLRDDLLDSDQARLSLQAWLASLPTVSIVIPVRNEKNLIAKLVKQLRDLKPSPEILFVDGKSDDGTVEEIERVGGKVLTTEDPPTRGKSMNLGAKQAQGGILLFLHADSDLSQSSYTKMIETLKGSSIVGGAFTHAFHNSQNDLRLKCIDSIILLRSHLLKFPYGDQGFFVKKSVWHDVGPYKELPLMEDVEWFERLKKSGKIKILNANLETSPRRLYQRGPLRCCLTNLYLVCLYKMGVSPEKLAKIYYR